MDGYKAHSAAMLRAPANTGSSVPPLPDLSTASPERVTEWTGWLRKVIDVNEVAEAIGVAAPVFADSVRLQCAAEEPQTREIRRAWRRPWHRESTTFPSSESRSRRHTP